MLQDFFYQFFYKVSYKDRSGSKDRCIEVVLVVRSASWLHDVCGLIPGKGR